MHLFSQDARNLPTRRLGCFLFRVNFLSEASPPASFQLIAQPQSCTLMACELNCSACVSRLSMWSRFRASGMCSKHNSVENHSKSLMECSCVAVWNEIGLSSAGDEWPMNVVREGASSHKETRGGEVRDSQNAYLRQVEISDGRTNSLISLMWRRLSPALRSDTSNTMYRSLIYLTSLLPLPFACHGRAQINGS
jgi:hypothetical protein